MSIQTFETDEKERLSRLLENNDTKLILESIWTVPKSVQRICEETHISVSTAYRKMDLLVNYKVVTKIFTMNAYRKREWIYEINKNFLNNIISSTLSY